MTKQQLVEKLKTDLSSEFRSIIQYVLHISTIKGASYQSTLDELEKHVGQELTHAKILARQIDFLGGKPANEVAAADTSTDPRTALEADLELERTQLENYRERVEQATEIGLPDVAEALAPLLEQTQEHVRDLEAVLEH